MCCRVLCCAVPCRAVLFHAVSCCSDLCSATPCCAVQAWVLCPGRPRRWIERKYCTRRCSSKAKLALGSCVHAFPRPPVLLAKVASHTFWL
eukprot:362671-Chlamydomonas_euryale.AAC.7